MHRSSRLTALFICILTLLPPLTAHALTLQEGLKIVTENGRDVAIARSDEEVAKGAVSLARSPWLPSLDLYGRETWLKDQPEAKTPFGPLPTSQDRFTTYGIKATQLIYDFGKTSSSISAAQFGLKAREAGTFRIRNRAAVEFIVAYCDLLEAEELLKVARDKEENVSSARAEYLPSVYLSGGYENSENRYQVHEDNWSVIAGVNINLFAGGATTSKVSMAKGELASLRFSREKLLDAVRLDVKAAWLDYQSSTAKVEVAASAVTQAAENLRLQRLRYQEGVGTSTEVLDAVTLMTTAETNAWKASFGVRRAEAALLYAMGRDLAGAYGATRNPK